jgi:hypothetical protein
VIPCSACIGKQYNAAKLHHYWSTLFRLSYSAPILNNCDKRVNNKLTLFGTVSWIVLKPLFIGYFCGKKGLVNIIKSDIVSKDGVSKKDDNHQRK